MTNPGGAIYRNYKVISVPQSLQFDAIPYSLFPGRGGREGEGLLRQLSVLNALTWCPLVTSFTQLELRNEATFPFSCTTNVPRSVSFDGSPNR